MSVKWIDLEMEDPEQRFFVNFSWFSLMERIEMGGEYGLFFVSQYNWFKSEVLIFMMIWACYATDSRSLKKFLKEIMNSHERISTW